MTVRLGPHEEQIIRKRSTSCGRTASTWDPRTQCPITALSGLPFLERRPRTSSRGADCLAVPAGGQFGLFTPCVYSGRKHPQRLTSMAEIRLGEPLQRGHREHRVRLGRTILLQLQAYDADAGAPRKATRYPFHSVQGMGTAGIQRICTGKRLHELRRRERLGKGNPDVRHGSWIAYGVVNDGGNPGERTGDGRTCRW